MNEQVVELIIRERKYVFKIPYNDYVPFKEAEQKIIDLVEKINPPAEKLDYGIVYAALQLAIENNRLAQKTKNESSDVEEKVDEISEKLNIFLNQ